MGVVNCTIRQCVGYCMASNFPAIQYNVRMIYMYGVYVIYS